MKTLLLFSIMGLIISCSLLRGGKLDSLPSKKSVEPFERCVVSRGGFTDSNCTACEHLLAGVPDSEVEKVIAGIK